MRTPIRQRITYANVVSSVALFLALGGVSYAAATLPRNSVGSQQIKPKAVASSDLRNKAVTRAKLGDGAVTPGKLSATSRALLQAGRPGPAGPAGPAGPSGAAGAGLLTGNLNVISAVTGGESYRRGTVSGSTSGTNSSVATASSVNGPRPMVLGGMAARVANDLPANAQVTVDLIVRDLFNTGDGTTPGPIRCTITGGAGANDTACSTATTVTVPPGAQLFIRVTTSATGGATADPGSAFWGIATAPA